MKKIAVVGIIALIGVAAYFVFSKKTKEEQLRDILVDDNNKIKSKLTDEEIEEFKDLLLSIQTISELREYTTAFEKLCNDKDADLLVVVEQLLPDSVQIAVMADWQEKGIVDVDSLSQQEIESGKMKSSFSEKNAAKRIDVKTITQSDIYSLLEYNDIYLKENNGKYSIHNVVKKVAQNPYWENDDILTVLNSGKYWIKTHKSDMSDTSILKLDSVEPKAESQL